MKFTRGIKVAAVLGLVLALVLTGCAKKTPATTAPTTAPTTAAPTTRTTAAPPTATTIAPSPTRTTTAPAPTTTAAPAPRGPRGELKVAIELSAAEVFDPTKAVLGSISAAMSPLHEYLVRTDQGGKATGVAERWEMAPDGNSWTFYIRKGIKFHNGDDLTARDVKFSLERYTLPDASYAYIRNATQSVEVVNDYTLRVVTKGPQPYYALYTGYLPGFQGMILPKDYFEKNGVDNFNARPIGAGPFKLARHARGDRFEWEAVSNHYRQVPDFQKVTVMIVPEETTRVATLKTGEADIIDVATDSVRGLEGAGFKVVGIGDAQLALAYYGAFDPRNQGKPTADLRVRQALSLAINRQEIGEALFAGKFRPPMPPGMGQNQAEIDVPYWRAESAKANRYDLNEAKRLMREAGYGNGFSIKLYYYRPEELNKAKVAQVLQGYWKQIGVNTELVDIAVAALMPLRRSGPNKGPADQLVGTLVLSRFDEADFPTLLLGALFSPSGGNNYTQSAIPGLDERVDGAGRVLDKDRRFKMINEALQLITDSYIAPVLGSAPGPVAFKPTIEVGGYARAKTIPDFIESIRRSQ